MGLPLLQTDQGAAARAMVIMLLVSCNQLRENSVWSCLIQLCNFEGTERGEGACSASSRWSLVPRSPAMFASLAARSHAAYTDKNLSHRCTVLLRCKQL